MSYTSSFPAEQETESNWPAQDNGTSGQRCEVMKAGNLRQNAERSMIERPGKSTQNGTGRNVLCVNEDETPTP